MADTEGSPPPPPPLPPPRRRPDLPRFLVLLLGLLGLLTLSLLIFLPFVAPIVLALILSTVGYPLFLKILRWVGMTRRGLASIITCLVLVLAVFVPVVWIGWSLINQADDALVQLRDGTRKIEAWGDDPERFIQKSPQLKASWDRVKPLFQWVRGKTTAPVAGSTETPGKDAPQPGAKESKQAGEGSPKNPDDAKPGPDVSIVSSVIERIGGFAATIVQNAFELLVKFVVMLYILFFFFKDGPRIALSLKRAVPLDEVNEERLWRTFRGVSRSIIRGSFGTAAIQGFISGIAFAIVGIPAVFWGVATAIASLIPPVGTGLILVPATLYLFLEGSTGSAIFLGVVTILVGALDNIVRPFLMGGDVMVHEIWLLLSILGGLNFFGPMGLIYGPMVLVFLGTFVRLFVEEERQTQPSAGGHASSPGSLPPPPD